MPETTVTFVVQRCRLKNDGEPNARGWQDWSRRSPDEPGARKVLEYAGSMAARLGWKVQYRLVKVEERRKVIA